MFGIALGYEDLNDHDHLRHDPVMAVLAGKLRPVRQQKCAPVAGKSTLNRLELSRPEPSRYKKISYRAEAIEALFVDLFLEAHAGAPDQIVIDLDATDDPLHGDQEGRFFHGYYDCFCYLPLYVFCGRHLLAAKLRTANQDAAAGSVEEMTRIVGQIRARWPAVKIILRGDSGFAREALMAWCEANGVDFLFGLQGNVRLVAEISSELDQAQAASGPTRAGPPDASRTSAIGLARRPGAVPAASSARPRSPRARRTRASWSPRSASRPGRPSRSTSSSTAPGATWRTASRSASSTCSPTVPPAPP